VVLISKDQTKLARKATVTIGRDALAQPQVLGSRLLHIYPHRHPFRTGQVSSGIHVKQRNPSPGTRCNQKGHRLQLDTKLVEATPEINSSKGETLQHHPRLGGQFGREATED
jgi:hypothetical protein